MRRITVPLPDHLAEAVEREARCSNRSVSAVTRAALTAHLGLVATEPRDLPFAAVGRSGHDSTARDMEELLDSA